MSEGTDAVEYHERTKHAPDSIGGGRLDFENKPRPDKRYRDLPTEPLDERIDPQAPALQSITGDRLDDSDPIDRRTVAALCYYTAGITKTIKRRGQTHTFRAASCTGALYHIDVYPVCGDLPDLEAGVYHYAPQDDALDRLRTGDYRGTLAAATHHEAVADAPVTLVFTSTWWRNAWKYGDRTYRHAFWDAGTMIGNLLATATALGHPATTVTGFADGTVTDLLGIDPTWEAPVAVVSVGVDDPVPDEKPVDPIDLATEPLSSDPIDYPLISEAWTASTLPDGATAAEWRTQGPRPVDGRGPGDGDRFPLQPVDRDTASSRPLAETIRRRGSCRDYSRTSVSFRKLSTILDRAITGVPLDVTDGTEMPLSFVDCYCLINDVTDLTDGAYQYHPPAGEFEQLAPGRCREEAEYLALGQALGGDAAVNLYFMADLPAVTAALGDRGYRVAQLEAAVTSGRLYLGTYAHRDLGGTGLTFFDDEVTDFFAPRASGQTPMFLYTIGVPA